MSSRLVSSRDLPSRVVTKIEYQGRLLEAGELDQQAGLLRVRSFLTPSGRRYLSIRCWIFWAVSPADGPRYLSQR